MPIDLQRFALLLAFILTAGYSRAQHTSSATADPADSATPAAIAADSLPGDAEIGEFKPAGDEAAEPDAPAEGLMIIEEVAGESEDAFGADSSEAAVDSIPPLEKEPELKSFVEADYPAYLQQQGIEGSALLEIMVSDSGTVDSAAVARSLHPVLDTAAMIALKKFRFAPAVAGGKPVPVLVQYEYRFSLREVIEKKVERYANFTGRLVEQGTKKPIGDAMVVITFVDTVSDTTLGVPFSAYRERIGAFEGQYLEEDRLVAITDSTGRFTFYSLPACTIAVTAPLPGYEEYEDKEVIYPNEEIEVTYRVRRVSYSDYEIVVYGQVEKKEVSRRQLTINEVKRIPGLSGDAVKVVQALPGVSRARFGGGAVVVRGAPTWDSKFYLDGVYLPQLYHFGGVKSTYNSDALESVDFYPGGYSTRYGGGIAGVIEIKGRPPKNDRWHGSLDLSTLDGSFMVEGPIGNKVSILASARRSFIGDIISWYIDNSSQDFPFSVSPAYWDYLARADYVPNDNHRIFLTAFGSRDSLYIFFPRAPGGSSEISSETDKLGSTVEFHMGLAGWEWKISERLLNSLRYTFVYGRTSFSVFGFFRMEGIARYNHIRDQFSATLNDRVLLKIGLDLSLIPYDMILTQPNATGAIQRDTTDNWLFGDLGGYANLELRPVENLLVVPGLRYDLYPELNHEGSFVPEFWNYEFDNTTRFYGDPSLRLSARYEAFDGHAFKGAVGTYNQTPQPMGMTTHPTWGDTMMSTTKAAHYVLGYEWQITDLINLDLQGYINQQWDIPRILGEADSNELASEAASGTPRIWAQDQRGRMHGLELMLRHDQGEHFFGWLAYTLARSERYDKHAEQWVLYDQDETHNIQIVASWRLRRDWDVGFRLRYVTGKPTTPVIGSAYHENIALPGFGPRFSPDYGPSNAFRLDPFFQLDIRVDKKLVFDKWIFSLYLDIQNLSYFIYKSPEFEVWDDFYKEKTTVPMFILPAIGFKAEF